MFNFLTVRSSSSWAFTFGRTDTSNLAKHQKSEGKFYPITCHEGTEGEWIYSSTLPLTSALDGGEWSTPRPCHFTRGSDPVLNVQGGPQGRSERARKILSPTGIRSPYRQARSESLCRLRCPGPQLRYNK